MLQLRGTLCAKSFIVALAALAATASFAQSSVTISGLVDAGYRSVSAPLGGDTKGGFQNGSATTTLNVAGTEDLGGGMKADFRVEFNPDLLGGAGVSGNVLQGTATTGASPSVRTSNGGLHQTFLGLSGNFGGVKVGRLNTSTLAAWGTGSVFGTALGSGYGTNGNMFTVGSSSLSNFNQTAPTRFNNAVEYTTPSFNGFTARALFVPKVDNTGAGNTNNASADTVPGTNRAGVTDIGAFYNNGPLNVAVSQQQHKFGANDVNGLVTPGASSRVANGDYKLTTLAANYNFGAATVYGAYWTEKQATVATTAAAPAVAIDAKAYMVGAKYALGNFDLMASYAKRDDKTTADVVGTSTTALANVDKKIFGLGVDYKLSKRTALWARYESKDPDSNRAGAFTTAAGASSSNDKTTTTAVGIRHTF